jgi:hypothetical protein
VRWWEREWEGREGEVVRGSLLRSGQGRGWKSSGRRWLLVFSRACSCSQQPAGSARAIGPPLQVPFLSPRLGPDAALAPGTGDLSRLAIANQRSAADETKLNNANHYNKTSVRWEKNSERCLEIRAPFLF